MNTRSKPDPVRLEIFKNLYQFIAEQMGIVLQNTARRHICHWWCGWGIERMKNERSGINWL